MGGGEDGRTVAYIEARSTYRVLSPRTDNITPNQTLIFAFFSLVFFFSSLLAFLNCQIHSERGSVYWLAWYDVVFSAFRIVDTNYSAYIITIINYRVVNIFLLRVDHANYK